MQKISAPVVEQRERHGPEHVGVQLLLALKSKNDPAGAPETARKTRPAFEKMSRIPRFARQEGRSSPLTRAARGEFTSRACRAPSGRAVNRPATRGRRGARAGLFELH
jgi:hypothetical protein